MKVLLTKKALKDYEEICRHPVLKDKVDNLIALLENRSLSETPVF